MRKVPALSIMAFTVALLTGCSGDQKNWNAKDISGMMPDLAYQLINTSGEAVTEQNTAGNIRMLSFGFTSCPDICPTTLQKLSQAINGIPEPLREDVQVVFVSVDPHRDTPDRLKSYVEFFDDSIIGLTGNEESLRALSKRYRTTFGYDDADEKGNYDVSHSSAVYVFDRQGQARLLVRPDQSLQSLKSDLTALAKEGA